MTEAPTRAQLEAAHCWDPSDHVPRIPEATAFRRRVRLHQARWRESNRHPIGSQPIVPRAGKPSHPVGNRLPVDYARETGATFLTPAALEAARERTSVVERHQSFDHQRFWAELLWAPALAFNLFGDLAADLALSDRAVRAWWPDTPGTVREVRFAHSPGRLDPAYLGNLVDWSAAFELELEDGRSGVLAIVTGYHDVNHRQAPKPSRLPRYREVMERSGVFTPTALEAVNGTELIHIWLDHLLVLSLLQHASGAWGWGRLVVVHPEGNTDFGSVCERYRGLLTDDSTFGSSTMEALLDAGTLPRKTVAALRARYLP